MDENKLKIFELKRNECKAYKITLLKEEGIFLTELEKQLINSEDILTIAYQDTKGIWTNGVGHTAGVVEGQNIDIQTAIKLLRKDIQIAKNDCIKLFKNFDNLSDIRKSCLIEMAFNLGYKNLSKFKKTIHYINMGEFVRAGLEMLDSDWHREDVKKRAARIAESFADDRRVY